MESVGGNRKSSHRPVCLIIRDGWGSAPDESGSADERGDVTLLADTPVHDALRSRFPCTTIEAAGEAVGLPAGQMGNSEVGHLNLGAGRIVYQEFGRISQAVRDGSFFENGALKQVVEDVKAAGSRLHLMGLCSDGGVHSHLDHLFALLDLAARHGVSEVFIHCFMDGRDTSPTSGAGYLSQIEEHAAKAGVGKIATVIGRYYAMDRDNRWERVSQAYDALVYGKGTLRNDAVACVRQWYEEGKTDEFIPPTLIVPDGVEPARQSIADNDGVVFFNFRADRARELTRALTTQSFDEFPREKCLKTYYVCMTPYESSFDLPVAFSPQKLNNTLAEVLAEHGLTQLRIAETEKYPHVTYFFNGGAEEPVVGEDRCLIPSPKVATYDLQPEMSAPEVTEELIARIRSGRYDVIIANYANPDMVGHTGVIPAAIRAVEVVDECLGRVLDAIKEVGGVSLITADHGNAERLLDKDGSPFTAHTSNEVELIYVGSDHQQWNLQSGILADIAPTILQLLDVEAPSEMTGKSLLVRP